MEKDEEWFIQRAQDNEIFAEVFDEVPLDSTSLRLNPHEKSLEEYMAAVVD